MTLHIERLIELVAPPETAPAHGGTSSAMLDLGFDLPSDYLELMETYGGGRFDRYLWILEPGCANPNYDMAHSLEERNEAFQMLWDAGEAKPIQLESGAGRVIPWASTDNGEFLYWLAQPGVHPNEWTILVNEARGDWWEHFEFGCVEFLTGLLTRNINSEILSVSFPLEIHEFKSAELF